MSENGVISDSTRPQEPCLIKVQLFEGPLDLLLHLIKKNEVDIYDIPVAAITEQYIQYLELMEDMNLEIAGEYLVIAAELSLIKSKMLLPKPVIEEEELDPRSELVKRLLEYQIYKDAASDLISRDILGRDVFKRDVDLTDEIVEEVEMVPVDLWALIEAFREFYERRSYIWAEEIVYEKEYLSVEDKMEQVVELLREKISMDFHEMLNECSSKFDLIITFLSILELARTQTIHIIHNRSDSSIQLAYPGETQIGAF